MSGTLEALVIRKTFRVPLPGGDPGDGSMAARQFDAALMSAGFKCSRDLLTHLSALDAGTVIDTAVCVLGVVRQLAGDHVAHNTYFRDFPANVPDTLEFWAQCLAEALVDPVAAERVSFMAGRHPVSGRVLTGGLNLLSLPSYGKYLHTYEEMLDAHQDLIESVKDRVTVLHLGATLDAEVHRLYLEWAGSRVPLSPEDLRELGALAQWCTDGEQPAVIPVRENRAVINRARLGRAGAALLADTATDVLRLACAASDGDVTLEKPTRFRSFSRRERRVMMAALDGVVMASRAKLGDVAQHGEQWKRLGERLHPHEHAGPGQDVFAVARGEMRAPSFGALMEASVRAGDIPGAVSLLTHAPGRLLRSLDWLLRSAGSQEDRDAVVKAAGAVHGDVSGRVLLSLREHFQNRHVRTDVSRVFANRRGRAWVTAETRPALGAGVLGEILALIDTEVGRRLPAVGHLVVDPAVLGVALPLSGKAVAPGLGMLPRGSVSPVDGDLLRFFIYWKQRHQRTDYDLSAIMLDSSYGSLEHVSWTNLRTGYAEHSGDITDATDGASEFINITLAQVTRQFVIPQVYVYSGEGFDEAEEAFFGFMLRGAEQEGQPFEPRTVRMKSDLRGAGRIALPLVFMRGEDGKWRAKWLHLYLRGHAAFNQVEGAKVTTGLLVRSIVERDYLRVKYLADLMAAKAQHAVTGEWPGTLDPGTPVTWIGLEQPENLPEGSEAYTLPRLSDLIPA